MLIAFAAFIGSRAIAALFAGRWHGNPRERSATLRAKTGLPPPYSAWQSSLSVTNWGDANKLSGPGHGIRQSASIAAMINGLAGISYYPTAFRSEEHTSELQSLMRISYAVFCLKKKNTHTAHHHEH